MWRCPQCNETSEDQFNACWRCGWEYDAERALEPPPPLPGPACTACGTTLEPRGRAPMRVRSSDEWTLFPTIEDSLESVWNVEVYACPNCRRLTFFEAAE